MKQLEDIFELYHSEITRESPVEWAEKNRYLTSEISAFPGLMSYDRFPYWKEPVNKMSPDDPARLISIMGGAQLGKSTGFIETAIGYLIKNYPAPMILTSADKEQSKIQMGKKVDQMIANSGLGFLIRPNTIKKKNLKTGDTDSVKEFPGGSLMAMSIQAINKISKQNSFRYGFFDDFEAALDSPKNDGDIGDLLLSRFNSFKDNMKACFISTPRTKGVSLIEASFLNGDQRYYMMPCPLCGKHIRFIWQTKTELGYVGVHFERDQNNRLIESSVGYICQECGGFFKESHKKEMLQNGKWIPTAEPSRPDWVSYHISGLYSPPGFYDWTHHAHQFIKCHPQEGIVNERNLQVFLNLTLGETYEETAKETSSSLISRNLREYKVGIVPDLLSVEDGNGNVVMLTCACDLNGMEDDCRLDYEILAHTESGSTYSIEHGSIGTFQRGLPKENRELWNYYHGQRNNVWDVFKGLVQRDFEMQSGGFMQIAIVGVDSGYFTNLVYEFVEAGINGISVLALKGDQDEQARKTRADTMTFKKSKEKYYLYLVQTNQIKDYLSDCMRLKKTESSQPSGFMNYPTSENGLYDYRYFEQYEAETRRPTNTSNGIEIAYVWQKKTSQSANHWFDCRVYNLVVRDIYAFNLVKIYNANSKIKIEYTWSNFIRYIYNAEN